MDSETDGFGRLVAALTVIAVAVVAVAVGHSAGYEAGVRDHADGKVVVVDLPDGTRVVVKPKPKEAP